MAFRGRIMVRFAMNTLLIIVLANAVVLASEGIARAPKKLDGRRFDYGDWRVYPGAGYGTPEP